MMSIEDLTKWSPSGHAYSMTGDGSDPITASGLMRKIDPDLFGNLSDQVLCHLATTEIEDPPPRTAHRVWAEIDASILWRRSVVDVWKRRRKAIREMAYPVITEHSWSARDPGVVIRLHWTVVLDVYRHYMLSLAQHIDPGHWNFFPEIRENFVDSVRLARRGVRSDCFGIYAGLKYQDPMCMVPGTESLWDPSIPRSAEDRIAAAWQDRCPAAIEEAIEEARTERPVRGADYPPDRPGAPSVNWDEWLDAHPEVARSMKR